MSRRAPLVRKIDMLPAEPHGSTTGFFRALEDADDMVHAREERDEALCRCDELQAQVEALQAERTRLRARLAVYERTGW